MRGLHLRRGDYVVLAVAAVAVLACLVWVWYPRQTADAVEVTTVAGTTRYPLSINRTVDIVGRDGIRLVVEVQDRRVRVRESGCPDHLCVDSGWLSQGGQAAACLPAGVSVRVVSNRASIDGVTS